MIVDTSAIVAIAQNEPQGPQLVATLLGDPQASLAAPTATECLIVLTSRLGPVGRTIYERIRAEFNIVISPFTDAHVIAALQAFTRFGKGRHQASLDFGDCMTYAAARVANEPLLAVGDDFPRTDLKFDGGVLGHWPAPHG